jgi:phage-related protein
MGKLKRKLLFIGSAKKDLSEMPNSVKLNFGYGLHEVQEGRHPSNAKVLSGFGSANIIELRANAIGNTYRVVYTVQFRDTVYVLHCFNKKSNSGIATPKPDIELIKSRLKIAIDNEKNE